MGSALLISLSCTISGLILAMWTLTFLMETRWKLLSLLKVWPWQHFQHLFDAPPARPSQNLSEPHTERSVTAVHVGDVIGVLIEKDHTSYEGTV